MRYERKLNYCGECGRKLKDIEEAGIKVRFCKKCKYYLPIEARYWVAFQDKEFKGNEMRKAATVIKMGIDKIKQDKN